MGRYPFCYVLCCLLCTALLLQATCLHADVASDAASRIDAAFEQLINEANDLGTVKQPEHRANFKRPHRAVRALKAQDGPVILERMAGKLAGDDYGDTYIRWHLMPAIETWLGSRATSADESSDASLTVQQVKIIQDLFRSMPPEAEPRYVSPYSDEGKEINKRLAQLRAKTRITVGVPPFEKTYSGRAALPHMTPAARKKAEPIVEEIDRLQDQVKGMRDRDIEQVNERYREVAKAMREYRFDLGYMMVQSGNQKLLNDVGSAVGTLIRRRQRAGFDVTQAIYKAMHDGYLNQYDDRALASLRENLMKTAASTRSYETYLRGNEPMPYYIQPELRCYAGYVYQLTDLLAEPTRLRAFRTVAEETEPDIPPLPVGPFEPESLSIDDIRAAIRAAVHELYTASRQPQRDEEYAPGPVLPNEFIRHDSYYFYLNRYRQKDPVYQEVIYETGNHALVASAMLAAGESYQDPRLNRRISWVLASDTPFTYDRGMRLMMLSRLPTGMFAEAAKRDAAWLGSAVTDMGNFNESYYYGQSTGFGDHGSGFYGVLGLWGADRLDIELNEKKVWSPIDKHWRLTQQKTPGDQPAGWAVGMLHEFAMRDADQPITTNSRTTVTGPMTAAGVASLTLTERYLNGPTLTEPGKDNVSVELRKGLRWLDENFDPAQSPGADWFYYMWTIQQVGKASGRRTFNGVDWFRTVTAEMLNRQGPDGLWEDPNGQQGKLLSTGFALLYLANALEPIAVSKLKFDGAWNNRPNDLWNYAEYASDVFEVDTAWQIVDLDQTLYELADTPLIYLATHEPFSLSRDQVDRLRQYIDIGGMLLINPEAPIGRLQASIDALIAELYPDKALEPVAEFHPFYDLHTKLRPTVQMQMVHNGVRPLVVVFNRDISRGLQTNDTKRQADSFAALSNIYLYAVGTQAQRTRLSSNYILPTDERPNDSIAVARILHNGSFNPEPAALTQLDAFMAREHGIDLDIQILEPGQLKDQRIAFLTTSGDGELSDAQAKALRDWVEAGGTLWLDAAGGTTKAVQAANAMLMKAFPDYPVLPLEQDSPIITGENLFFGPHDVRRVSYSRFAQRQMGQMTTPRLQAIKIDGRVAVIFSPEDLTAALAGCEHWGLFGYSPQSARKLIANGILATVQ